MILTGNVHKFGDNINTDYIIAGKYRSLSHDMDALSKKIFEDLDPEFYKKVQPGDFIVAGENFGCGSSREYAPKVLIHVGIKAVLAKSFARIFFRNSINLSLPVISCETDGLKDREKIEIHLEKGKIYSLDSTLEQSFPGYPKIITEILKGGLLEFIKKNPGLHN